jgi:ribosomal protein S18 acetylase RimI-like enzyme
MTIAKYRFDLQKANAYLDFCNELYRNDATWIAPLRQRALAQFSPDFAFYRHPGNAHQHFLATAAGATVGHASAMVNARLKDQDGAAVGIVGFFECVDDAAVARELLGHACDWLRMQHGARRIWGPMQFDVWHGYRLMTRGFETDTFFGEPYNKPYYPALFESSGFAVRKIWYSVAISGRKALSGLLEPWREDHARVLREGYRFAPIDLQDASAVAVLQSAIEGSYRNFLGLTQLGLEEFSEVFAAYARALDPRFAIGAWDAGENLAGFAIAYPDYARALRAMRGRETLLAKVGFYLRSRAVKRAVFFMIGITPKEAARRRGLGRALYFHCLNALLDAGIESVVFALLADDSPAWFLLGGRKNQPEKQYSLYEVRLEP